MIIFLDFDGVLNAEKDFADKTPAAHFISHEKVAILNRIPETLPGALFVLSTSWRVEEYFADADDQISGVNARESLKEHGFKGEFHEAWHTPWKSKDIT
jgi:hypothetical protein